MVHDEPMPKWLEEELKQLGVQAPPAEPKPAPPKIEEQDKWWERGEECPF